MTLISRQDEPAWVCQRAAHGLTAQGDWASVPVPDADFGMSSWSLRKVGEKYRFLHACKTKLGFAVTMMNWPAMAAVCVLDIGL